MSNIEDALSNLSTRAIEEADYRRFAAEAYQNLRKVADELEKDSSGRGLTFFETFGRVKLFEYDGREDPNHGIFYALANRKIIVKIGKKDASTEDFLALFTEDSLRDLDIQARRALLKNITYEEITRRLSEFQRN